MPTTTQIDAVLRDAVTSGQVPGVTAAAANADGVIAEAAFGAAPWRQCANDQ